MTTITKTVQYGALIESVTVKAPTPEQALDTLQKVEDASALKQQINRQRNTTLPRMDA